MGNESVFLASRVAIPHFLSTPEVVHINKPQAAVGNDRMSYVDVESRCAVCHLCSDIIVVLHRFTLLL